jgi:hypothetical protein
MLLLIEAAEDPADVGRIWPAITRILRGEGAGL